MIRDFAAGDAIPLTAWKDGSTEVLKIHSRTFPEALAEELAYKSLGVRIQEISRAMRLRFRIAARDGVMVAELRPGSYLDRIGVRPGDVIRRINEKEVKTVDDFKGAVTKYRHKESAVLLIQRGNQQYYVTVKIEI